jgi:hypothetical protein
MATIKEAILTPSTLVPVACLVPLICFAFWLGGMMNDVNHKLDGLVMFQRAESWTVYDERTVWADFKILNPSILTPDVLSIRRERLNSTP